MSFARLKVLPPTIAALLFSTPFTLGSAAESQALPRWESGIGLGILSLPFYRGTDDDHTYILPIPYIRYHSEHVRVAEDDVRSRQPLGSTPA